MVLAGDVNRRKKKRGKDGKNDIVSRSDHGLWNRARQLAERCIVGLTKTERSGNPERAMERQKSKRFRLPDLVALTKNVEMLEWKMNMLEKIAKSTVINDKFESPRHLENDYTVLIDGEENIEIPSFECVQIRSADDSKDPIKEQPLTIINPNQVDLLHYPKEFYFQKTEGRICCLQSNPFYTPYVYSVMWSEGVLKKIVSFQSQTDPSAAAACKLSYVKEDHQIIIDYKNNMTSRAGRISLRELGKGLETVQVELIGRLVCYLLGMLPPTGEQSDDPLISET